MFAGLFELALNNIASPVFVKDADSKIVYANQAFIELYPLEHRDKILGYTTVEHFTPEEVELFLSEDRIAMSKGESTVREEIIDHTGLKRVFLTRKIAVTGPQGQKRLLGICEDITELSTKEKSLVQANELLRSFSAIAAHDLISPLGAAVSGIELIKLEKNNTLTSKSAAILDETVQLLRNLCDDVSSLLMATKAIENKTSLTYTKTDLNMIIEEVRFAMTVQLDRCCGTLYSVRLPTLQVEKSLFRQVIQNIVENSIKYKAPDRRLRILIKHRLIDGHDEISIEDNGIGVPPEKFEQIFGLFEQDQNSHQGLGIGLSLCKRIVEMHNGRIFFDTSFTQGSCIKILLPRANADETTQSKNFNTNVVKLQKKMQ